MTVYWGCSYNLLNSRNPLEVETEILDLIKTYNLDFIATQESAGYYSMLQDFKGYDYYSGTGPRYNKQNGFLVKNKHFVDNEHLFRYGDGWRTKTGSYAAGGGQFRIRLNNKLVMRSIHLPTPTNWVNGKLESPPERRDDYILEAKALRRFMMYPAVTRPRLSIGDWNEQPFTRGEYSPTWIRRGTRSKVAVPEVRKGGRIDWVNYKGCQITECFKDTKVREKSDHEPVIFKIVV